MSQSGTFNVLDNNMDPSFTGAANHDALQQLINSLLSSSGPTKGYGGTILFPSVGTFNISKGTTFPTGEIDINHGVVPGAAIIFVGSGQQAASAPNIVKEDTGDLFVVQNNDTTGGNISGIVFQDLMIGYSTGITSGAAIRLDNAPGTSAAAQNVRIFRVVFQDCPTAVNFHASLSCSMLECFVVSTGGNGNTQNGIILGGSPVAALETYIAGCRFLTSNDNQTGIVVNNTEHLRVMNTRIEAFQIGIALQPQGQSFRNHFENVSVRETTNSTTTGAAVLIQPQGGSLSRKQLSSAAISDRVIRAVRSTLWAASTSILG